MGKDSAEKMEARACQRCRVSEGETAIATEMLDTLLNKMWTERARRARPRERARSLVHACGHRLMRVCILITQELDTYKALLLLEHRALPADVATKPTAHEVHTNTHSDTHTQTATQTHTHAHNAT